MNYIDYVIIILLVISAVRGLIKGFIYEITSLIALIAGVWGAIEFSGATEIFLVKRLGFTSEHINIIAFLITFVLIIILVHFIGKAVEKAVESVALGVANRIFGLFFSILKTAFILGIIVILVEKLDESFPFVPKNDISESKFYAPLRGVAISTFPFINNFYKDIKGVSDDNDKSYESSDDEEKDSIH